MRIEIKNFGMIEEAKIDIDGLTVIAGYNDTGKSTIGKVAYSLTKTFEGFEKNYERLRRIRINRYLRLSYMELRSHQEEKDPDLTKILKEIRPIFYSIYRNKLFTRIKNKSEDFESLSKKINKFKKEMNKTKLETKSKNTIIGFFKKIESLCKESKSSEEKIKELADDIFESEFKGQINNSPDTIKDAEVKLTDGEKEIIRFKFNEGHIKEYTPKKGMDTIFPFDSSVFIETPFILNNEFIPKAHHTENLIDKIKTDVNGNKRKDNLNISKIIGGKVYYVSELKDDFVFEKNLGNKKTESFLMQNTASGIRSFGILQMLDSLGEFDIEKKTTLLIIDEPEVHLHPEWQIEYAKVLVELVKKDVAVLVTSHSPYLIEALNKFSEDEELEDKTKFYLSKYESNGLIKIEDVNEEKGDIFDLLSKPYDKLIFDDEDDKQ